VASVGILGAVVASLIGDYFDWKVAYIVGGTLGLGLLGMRAGLLESSLFDRAQGPQARQGQFHRLFSSSKNLIKYFSCIAVGLPIWFVVGILITFSPELSQTLAVNGIISANKSIIWNQHSGHGGNYCS
jgi:predicted MFS family arabinose efflux permease